jgi:dCTP diphosphatase
MSEKEALDALRMMVRDRDWEQFHSLENLAKSVAIEAGELLECFQWANAAPNDRIIGELADVLTYCYLLAAKLGVEPSEAVINKLDLTRSKYPVDEARGTGAKYTDL